MQFANTLTFSASLLAALVAAQSANVAITSQCRSVQAGQNCRIEYKAGPGPVTLTLRSGDPGALETVKVITSTAPGGDGSFDVPTKDLPNGSTYAIQISQGGETNYSGQFSVGGSTVTALPNASETASASSKAASSSRSASAASSRSSASESSESSESKSASRTSSGRSTATETEESTTTETEEATSSRTRSSSSTSAATAAATDNAAAVVDIAGTSSLTLLLGAFAAFFL